MPATRSGLEDSGVAPEIAVNRSEAPPALLTSQKDIGLRYAFGPMRLVVGGFDVRKPYFNLDPGLVFGSSAPSAIAASKFRLPGSRSRASTSSPARC